MELRQQSLEGRLDKAAGVVQDLRRRVHVLEEHLDPTSYITTEQQAGILHAVKALALLLSGRDGKNHFQGVWGEIHRRWSVPDYQHLRQRDWQAVMDFLDDWHRAVLQGVTAPPPETPP